MVAQVNAPMRCDGVTLKVTCKERIHWDEERVTYRQDKYVQVAHAGLFVRLDWQAASSEIVGATKQPTTGGFP